MKYLQKNSGIENSSICDKKIEEETIFSYFREKKAEEWRNCEAKTKREKLIESMETLLKNNKITSASFASDTAQNLSEGKKYTRRICRMYYLYYAYLSEYDQALSIPEKLVTNALFLVDNFDEEFMDVYSERIYDAFSKLCEMADTGVVHCELYKPDSPSVFPTEFVKWSKNISKFVRDEPLDLDDNKMMELEDDVICMNAYIQKYLIQYYYAAWYYLYERKMVKKVKKPIQQVINELEFNYAYMNNIIASPSPGSYKGNIDISPMYAAFLELRPIQRLLVRVDTFEAYPPDMREYRATRYFPSYLAHWMQSDRFPLITIVFKCLELAVKDCHYEKLCELAVKTCLETHKLIRDYDNLDDVNVPHNSSVVELYRKRVCYYICGAALLQTVKELEKDKNQLQKRLIKCFSYDKKDLEKVADNNVEMQEVKAISNEVDKREIENCQMIRIKLSLFNHMWNLEDEVVNKNFNDHLQKTKLKNEFLPYVQLQVIQNHRKKDLKNSLKELMENYIQKPNLDAYAVTISVALLPLSSFF